MTNTPQLQPNGATFPRRYWTEFLALRSYLPAGEDPSILSFGCSLGDELFSLRDLFPMAHLFGCESDPGRLAVARERTASFATTFASDVGELGRHGPFDIVVVNSVLLDSDRPDQGVDAKAWLDVVALLDSVLKPGGLLQVINSNMAFRRHPVAQGYMPLRHPMVAGSNFVSQFDLDGVFLAEGIAGLGRSAHLHRHIARPRWDELEAHDLDDIHFRKAGGPDDRGQAPAAVKGLAGMIAASGSASHRPPADPRVTSYVAIDLNWTSTATEVLIERRTQRIWFDGGVAYERLGFVRLADADAQAFIETMTARPPAGLTEWSGLSG